MAGVAGTAHVAFGKGVGAYGQAPHVALLFQCGPSRAARCPFCGLCHDIALT